MPDDTSYTIADLARLTGLNVRTIRYYIAQGLIPASGESGPGAHYGQGHLDRLRLTKRLQQQHLPLAEIRQRLADLSDEEIAGLLQTTPEAAGSETSALDYVRSVLGATGGPVAAPPPASSPTPSAPPLLASRAAISDEELQTPPRTGQSGAGRFAMLREAPAPLSRVVPLPEVLHRAVGMPRMKDIPAPDPRVAAAEAKAIRDAVARAAPRASERQPPERSQWERLSLGPNIELHVRRPLSRLEQRRVERLITIARQVLKEDGV